jgi:hypothetical protein
MPTQILAIVLIAGLLSGCVTIESKIPKNVSRDPLVRNISYAVNETARNLSNATQIVNSPILVKTDAPIAGLYFRNDEYNWSAVVNGTYVLSDSHNVTPWNVTVRPGSNVTIFLPVSNASWRSVCMYDAPQDRAALNGWFLMGENIVDFEFHHGAIGNPSLGYFAENKEGQKISDGLTEDGVQDMDCGVAPQGAS